MRLEEIFDTKQNVEWNKTGNFEFTSFTVNNIKYIIQIENTGSKFPELNNYKNAEITFRLSNIKTDDAFHTANKLNKSISPLKVYGTVMNSLADKFKEYDSFYFSVLKRHSTNNNEFDSKRRIYSDLLNRLRMKYRTYKYEHKECDGIEFLVSKIPLSRETQIEFDYVNPMVEASVNCGFMTWDEASDDLW